MLRVLTLATLFPDATRPNFGVFVERQTLGLAAHAGVDLRLIAPVGLPPRSEEHTSELQSLMRISYAVFCLKKTTINTTFQHTSSKVIVLQSTHSPHSMLCLLT